jgi:hypothetical protein
MKENNEENNSTLPLFWFLVIVGLLILVYISGIHQGRKEVTFTNEYDVESAIGQNDTIKLKIKKLDSIKHEKVVEIYTLDNDSTIKLFYELVSE